MLIQARGKVNASAFQVGLRLYLVHTDKHDGGYSMIEATDESEMFFFMSNLSKILGSIVNVWISPNENTVPPQRH